MSRTPNARRLSVEKQVAGALKLSCHSDMDEALQSTERSLSLIINTIPTFVWSARPDGYCDFVNQRWLDYTGMTAEEATGWGWGEAIHPNDRRGLVTYWRSCLDSGLPGETEARMRRYDSAYRWFLFRANPLRNTSGTLVRWYGSNVDIEDRKHGEEVLRASELSWRQIVDSIPGLVATTGAMGEVEFLNRQTLEYFGKTAEELKSWALTDAVHPDDLLRVIEVRKESIETGQIYDVEHRCRRADGVYRWFQVRGLPVRNAVGTIMAWYLLLTDIDDRKKVEEALKASERNLNLTIDTIPTFIQVSRPDGSVLSVNQTVLDYHGVTLEDVQKEDFRSRFYHPDDMERLRVLRKEALAQPRQFEYEQRALSREGQYRWFLVRYNPLLDSQGRIERWYATAFDIEDRKRAEEALSRARAELAHMARVTTLSALAASITHEINQPIAAVITSADACLRWLNRDQPDEQRAREAVMRIQEDGRRAAEIISHLKSLYRKDVSPQREPVSPNDVAREMLVLLHSEADRHAVAMRADLAVDLPFVSADRVQLQQVLMNLMLNGMEAMRERGGELSIRTRGERGCVLVSVCDAGVGIPADKTEQIFNAFFTTKPAGTGMGLAISRTIIEWHGGRLWATPNAECGATFHFTLPTNHEA